MTYPRPATRAPLVSHLERVPLTPALSFALLAYCSAKTRASAFQPAPAPVAGQLWQRFAERATVVELSDYPRNRAPIGARWRGLVDRRDRGPLATETSPGLIYQDVYSTLERRRPVMRARALTRLRADGAPLYRVSLDGSGRLERNS